MEDRDGSGFNLGAAIVRKVKLGNALDTLLVLSVVAILVCIPSYVITREFFLLIIVFALVSVFAGVFVYLMLKKPNLLRSEQHEERMLQLSSGLGEKGAEIEESRMDKLYEVDAKTFELNKNKQIEDGESL